MRLGKQTYVGAIISKVVDNVQIHIKNIHVRYEDGSSTPEVSNANEAIKTLGLTSSIPSLPVSPWPNSRLSRPTETGSKPLSRAAAKVYTR